MIWVFFIIVGVLLIGGLVALVAGRLPYDPMAEATTSQRDPGLPEAFHATDIADVHFDTALRGYRMDQVDAVLDRLQDRIAELEASHTSPVEHSPVERTPVERPSTPAHPATPS